MHSGVRVSYEQHPKDERVQKNYIQLLILDSRLEDATKLTDTLLKERPQDIDGLIMRGQILNAQGHSNEAAQSLESALKADPQNPGPTTVWVSRWLRWGIQDGR